VEALGLVAAASGSAGKSARRRRPDQTYQQPGSGFAVSPGVNNGDSAIRRPRHLAHASSLALATAAILACLAGCSSGVIFNAGPLGGQEATGITCGVADGRGGVATYGAINFPNSSASPVTITRVSLADPDGLSMHAAYVVPITGTLLYGFLPGYPPEKHIPHGIQWSERQRADGARLPHSRDHDFYSLVAVLQPTRNPGWARGINIYYHSSHGQRYLLRQGLQILVGINRCPNNTVRYERP
jgi:hypothetical protein